MPPVIVTWLPCRIKAMPEYWSEGDVDSIYDVFSHEKIDIEGETDRGRKVVLDPWSSRPVWETLAVVGGAGGNDFFYFLQSEKHIK